MTDIFVVVLLCGFIAVVAAAYMKDRDLEQCQTFLKELTR